ncbi:TetR/AcrR family transcriptional regulator [Nonomuraea mangrovi]|uniref:TetR/AcrR family transcriptional regulator n=1 Tax=Nonomuraea mangrovi TaxID=2316207 RepID=A0ABW4T5J3_9ACTN
MPRGPTKRRPQTRARLLEAAFTVFAERGFQSTSIEDICTQAGFTRGAFYSNFASKDELFLALFDLQGQRVLDRLRRIDPPSGDDAFTRVVEAAVETSEDERRWHLVSAEFNLYAIRHSDAARALAAHEARVREALAGLLGELFAAVGVTATVPLDELARLVIAVIDGARAQSYVEPDVLPAGRLERLFLPLIMNAVTVPTR